MYLKQRRWKPKDSIKPCRPVMTISVCSLWVRISAAFVTAHHKKIILMCHNVHTCDQQCQIWPKYFELSLCYFSFPEESYSNKSFVFLNTCHYIKLHGPTYNNAQIRATYHSISYSSCLVSHELVSYCLSYSHSRLNRWTDRLTDYSSWLFYLRYKLCLNVTRLFDLAVATSVRVWFSYITSFKVKWKWKVCDVILQDDVTRSLYCVHCREGSYCNAS
jgi:hypothetical protein